MTFLVTYRFPFWFINLDFEKEFIFKKYALECGEFSCTRIWIRGFLSNFKSIQNSICNYILKKDVLKTNERKGLIGSWTITRFTWPRGIFLSNLPLNYVVCKEAGTISLPVVAMIDTNIKSFLFSYPIPSNDDALDSICYIINMLSKKLLLLKYKNVLLWYNRYKIKNIKFINVLKNLGFKKQYYKHKRKKYVQMVKIKHFKYHFYSSLLQKKNWCNLMISKLFSNFIHLKKNFKLINKAVSKKSKTLYDEEDNIQNPLLYRKLKFLKKLKIRQDFYGKFLKKYNYKLTGGQPKKVLLNAVKLQYLIYYKRKKNKHKNKQKFYFNYLTLAKLIKRMRTFYESFFINKPSEFDFVRRCHLPKQFVDSNQGYWQHRKDPDKWYEYQGYKFKLNEDFKKKWLNNKFNIRFKNKKWQKISYLSDSAVVLNTDRWVNIEKRIFLLRRLRRTTLNYWLFPFISKFAIKDGFRWYHPKFFYKEDKKFRRYFNWKLRKIKTPLSALKYYNNWFFFLLKYKALFKDKLRKVYGKKYGKKKKLKLKFRYKIIERHDF